VQEEAGIVGKTWREVMATVGNTVRWCCFVEDLCSEVKEKELTSLDYYCRHRLKVDQWRFFCKNCS